MGDSTKSPVFVSDVAEGIVATLSDPSSVGATYEFTGPKSYTMEELVEYIGASTRKPVSTVPLPELATPLVLFGMKLAGLPRLKILPSEEEFYQYGTSDLTTKHAAGLAELGVTPTQLEAVGLTILRQYRSHVYHDDIDALTASK
jgi:NADH dehydrogenase